MNEEKRGRCFTFGFVGDVFEAAGDANA